MAERVAVRSAGDEEQVGKAKRRQKFARDVELDDLRAVLSIPAGRRLLWRTLTHCSAFSSVFAVDPTTMAHNAGRQDVGHWLMHEIEIAKPDAFLTMMQEHAPKSEPDTTEKE